VLAFWHFPPPPSHPSQIPKISSRLKNQTPASQRPAVLAEKEKEHTKKKKKKERNTPFEHVEHTSKRGKKTEQ
jgi:hypothetical protein